MHWKTKAWKAAEAFREKHLRGKLSHLPVDVFSLVEIELGLDVIPFDDLFAKYSVDAALTADFTGIYVDAEAYILMEKGPEWKLNRLRFSLAHELGHHVMHRNLKPSFSSVDDFALWTQDYGGRMAELEREANEFAGRLLVPEKVLRHEFDVFARQADKLLPNWRVDADIRRKAAERIAPRFGVHPQAIEARFDREGIWPKPY
jgi:Zn-dependent peptidase ImmA (M78 family)